MHTEHIHTAKRKVADTDRAVCTGQVGEPVEEESEEMLAVQLMLDLSDDVVAARLDAILPRKRA